MGPGKRAHETDGAMGVGQGQEVGLVGGLCERQPVLENARRNALSRKRLGDQLALRQNMLFHLRQKLRLRRARWKRK